MFYTFFSQNVVPEHVSDVVIFVDSINLIFEESSKGNPSVSLPIACIEPGDDHCLPNLALRLVIYLDFEFAYISLKAFRP